MDSKDTLSRTVKETNLSSNSDYYKHVFKKTEKIVCAVFYTVRANKDTRAEDSLIRNIEDTAERVTRASFVALRAPQNQSEWATRELGYMLMELESAFRVAHAGRLLSSELLQVFVVEIDSVLRALKSYTDPKVSNPLFDIHTFEFPRERKQQQVRIQTTTRGLTLTEGGSGESLNTWSRTEQILAVLKDKGQASIKDISEVVTDCSEKTIQRELTSLIKDNKIRRDGERRWSKYSLV